MANNYLEFSEVISELSNDEAAWLDDQLQPIVVIDKTVYPGDEVPDQLDVEQASYHGPKFLRNAKGIDVWEDEPEFRFSFEREESRCCHLWIYSDGYGSVEQVAMLVQKFLRAFRPNDLWTLTYSTTCSKPRVGEFGGGAVVVTARAIRWHDTEAITAKAIKAHQRRQQRRSAA